LKKFTVGFLVDKERPRARVIGLQQLAPPSIEII